MSEQNAESVPIRVCCGQRHHSPVCPDGMVMCCLCFERVPQDRLAVEDGQKVDVCQPCRDYELERLAHIDGSPHWIGVDGNCDRCGQHEPVEGSECPAHRDGCQTQENEA